MLTKDLFSTKFERELHEGAIDNLEARYIDDLNRKMDDLLARARQATDPQHKAALKREYQQVKSTRAEYFGANNNTNLDEGAMKRQMEADAERMSREQFCDKYGDEHGEFWDNLMGDLNEAGIGQDIVNRTEKIARATPPTPAGKVASTVKNAAKWLAGKGGPGREGPTYEGAEDIVDRGEYDREGDMAKDNIHTIVRNARELESILGNNDNLPEWVQDKLANIKGMMIAVSEYMQTQHERDHSGIQKKSFEAVAEGGQDFNKVEPYAVCLAGRPVKKFDYYEQARRFHDNWKQKLYREGDRAKADKITLMPLNLDESTRGEAIKQGYQAAVKGLSKQQNPYYKSVNGKTPPAAYDWEAGWDDANATGKIPQLDVEEGKKKKSKKKSSRSMQGYFFPGYAYYGFGDSGEGGDGGGESITHKMSEAEDRVDPILIKALDRMPDGLNSHGQVLNAAYDAFAMELGRMEMKSQYGVTRAYIPQLMDLYKEKYGLTFKESANPAQQAAIAIAKKKEQGVDEAQTDYQKRRQRERDVDAGKPVTKQRPSKMTDYQKRRAQDRKEMELGENDQDTSGVERAILNRIMVSHLDWLQKFGPEKVMQAAEEVAYNVGDVDEIGTSDVSAYVREVGQILGAVQ